jgi:hypothetical protein
VAGPKSTKDLFRQFIRGGGGGIVIPKLKVPARDAGRAHARGARVARLTSLLSCADALIHDNAVRSRARVCLIGPFMLKTRVWGSAAPAVKAEARALVRMNVAVHHSRHSGCGLFSCFTHGRIDVRIAEGGLVVHSSAF